MAVSPVPSSKRKAAPEKPAGGLPSPRKRTKNPGVRVIGGRIYDSQNGKTCHQCRQKTMDFFAPCKNERNGKPCPIGFCHKCLLNRYGENAEEVSKLDKWSCPKCRGVCNCSFCMKKRGHEPTGILVRTAKANGFNSVSDLLHYNILEPAKEKLEKDDKEKKNHKIDKSKPEKEFLGEESTVYNVKKKRAFILENCRTGEKHEPYVDTFNQTEENATLVTSEVAKVPVKSNDHNKRQKKHSAKENNEPIKQKEAEKNKKSADIKKVLSEVVEQPQVTEAVLKCLEHKTGRSKKLTGLSIPLPNGSSLTSVAGFELAVEDVGPVLQFLEFCAAFEKVLGLKKGHAETVLRELLRGPIGRRGLQQSIIQFHIKLLSTILKDMGQKPSSSAANDGLWLQALGDCISKSKGPTKDLPTGLLSKGITGYNTLEFSDKLKVLNFLCDEALSTSELRCWIDEENERFIEKKKQERKNLFEAKEKSKSVRQKLKDELAQALLSLGGDTTPTISVHDKLFSEIKEKMKQIHAQLRDAVGIPSKKKHHSDAVRTEPALLEGSGQAFWKLKSCEGSLGVLLQDIGNWESISCTDKWFIYNKEQQKVIEKHLMVARKQRSMLKKMLQQEASNNENRSASYITIDAS